MLFYLPFPEAIQLQQTDTYALLTRAPLIYKASFLYSVRLACVKPAASVRSEPGSNSHVNTFNTNLPFAPTSVSKITLFLAYLLN